MLREDTPGWILARVHGLNFNEDSGHVIHLTFPSGFPTQDDLNEITARVWGVGLGLKLLTVLPRSASDWHSKTMSGGSGRFEGFGFDE